MADLDDAPSTLTSPDGMESHTEQDVTESTSQDDETAASARSQDLFRYDPISASEEIRLLRITSPKGSKDIKITLELSLLQTGEERFIFDVHRRAARYKRFVALSYTWGDANPQEEIRVNDRKMLVGRNCHYALWQLSLHYEDTLFWIDAICINQHNLAEKSKQVQMMYIIYEQSDEVAVGIGPHFDDSKMLMDVAREFHDHFPKDQTDTPRILHSLMFDSVSVEHMPYPELRSRNAPALDLRRAVRTQHALRSFGGRMYWRRLWTVQELVSAPSVRILCEADVVPLKYIINLSYYFSFRRFDSIFDGPAVKAGTTLSHGMQDLDEKSLWHLWRLTTSPGMLRPVIKALPMWTTIITQEVHQVMREVSQLAEDYDEAGQNVPCYIRLNRFRMADRCFALHPRREALEFWTKDQREQPFLTHAGALSRFRSWECTDRRDMLYGLLNVTWHPNEIAKPVPDYSKSVLEIALEALGTPITVHDIRNGLSIIEHTKLICEVFQLDLNHPDILLAMSTRARSLTALTDERHWVGNPGVITTHAISLYSNSLINLLHRLPQDDLVRFPFACNGYTWDLNAILAPTFDETPTLVGVAGKSLEKRDFLAPLADQTAGGYVSCVIVRPQTKALWSIVGQALLLPEYHLSRLARPTAGLLDLHLDLHLDSEDLLVLLCQQRWFETMKDTGAERRHPISKLSFLNNRVCRTPHSSYAVDRSVE